MVCIPSQNDPQKWFFSKSVPTLFQLFLEQLLPELAYKAIFYASQVRMTPKNVFFKICSNFVPTFLEQLWPKLAYKLQYGIHPKSEWPPKNVIFFKICSNFVPTFLEQVGPKLSYKLIWYASQVRKTPQKCFFQNLLQLCSNFFGNNFDLNLRINRYGMNPKSEWPLKIFFFSKSVPTLFQLFWNEFNLNLLINSILYVSQVRMTPKNCFFKICSNFFRTTLT